MNGQDNGSFVVGFSGFGGAGLNDAYLISVDSTGAIDGQILAGNTGDDVARRVLFDGPFGYIVGNTRSTVSAPDDIFITKVNFAGFPSVVWSKEYEGPGAESAVDLVLLPNLGV